jgi:hypothetical protein
MPDKITWNFEESLIFIRDLAFKCQEVGYDVALAGSILKSGKSSKDLDIIIYPLSTNNLNRKKLEECLKLFNLRKVRSLEEVLTGWRKQGSFDSKHVEEWQTLDNKRVDFFFLK